MRLRAGKRRSTAEQRYKENLRKQQWALEDFVKHETGWAEDLLSCYRIQKKEMPDDEYAACVYFQNKDYIRKLGSLTLLYQVYLRLPEELPEVTRENAFDLLRFRYRMYSSALKKAGFLEPEKPIIQILPQRVKNARTYRR